jgi:PHP family Zn ribbon phosphoesterase
MLLADLHIHTNYSDGKLSIAEVVDLFGKRGVNVIAITDHLCEEKTFLGKASKVLKKTLTEESFPIYLEEIHEQAQRAMRDYGMLVLPGVELTKNSVSFSRSAHIVAVGIKDYISADGEIIDILRRIKDQNALSIAAHPVSTRMLEHQTYHLWDNRHELKDWFDAWEVASGAFLFDEVLRSGLPMIANSDLHLPKQIRSWKTLLKCDLNFDSVKEAIKTQKIQLTFFEDHIESKNQLRPFFFSVRDYSGNAELI